MPAKPRSPAKRPPRRAAPLAADAQDLLGEIGDGRVTLSLHEGVYPLSCVHGVAYQLLARAWVRLDRAKDGRTIVRLTPKPGAPSDHAALAALAGEFANELTNQYVRDEVAARTTRVREAVVGRALLGALGTGDELSGLDTGLDAGDPAADPLGIAQDWEARFGHPADKPRQGLHASDPGPAAAEAELAKRR